MLWLSTPPPNEIDPNIVTPGVLGFVVTIALVLIVTVLVVDMTRRTRRLRYRAEANAKLDAEEAAERDASGRE
ncbi:hypothetical protein [Pseudolysinimonas sp.]